MTDEPTLAPGTDAEGKPHGDAQGTHSPDPSVTLPSVTLRRRLEWMDTDAADRWHHSVVLRWMEAGEAELHRSMGIIDRTFGATPRVAVQSNFAAPVVFDDEVDITVAVARMGTTSVTYSWEIAIVDGPRAAWGELVVVFVDDNGDTLPWPADIRAALSGETTGRSDS